MNRRIRAWLNGLGLGAFGSDEAERRGVSEAFAQYLSPELIEKLAKEPDTLRLGGELREISVLRCSAHNFDDLAAKLAIQDLPAVLNRYLTSLSAAILNNEGMIDNYFRDRIVAIWNAPIDDPNHAKRACSAALGMLSQIEILNREMSSDVDGRNTETFRFDIGVGLGTGECVVGTIGSDQRFEYSALGKPVDRASRFEQATKTYGVKIIIGEETKAAVPEFATLALDVVLDKGSSSPLEIFALLGETTLKENGNFRNLAKAHDAMICAYRSQDWERAQVLVQECRGVGAELSRLYDFYDYRITHLSENAPGADWNGVFPARS